MFSSPRRAGLVTLALLLVGLVVPIGVPAFVASASASEPSVESQLLSLTNSARTSAGLPALHTSSTLTSIARSWSNHMASTHSLVHNGSLGSQVGGWSQIGENIAMAWSASQAQSLFMGSSGHRANILNRGYNYVGIGVTKASDGSLWFTVDFMQSASYHPPAKPKPVPKPASRPTVTHTTSSSRSTLAQRSTRSTVRVAPKAVAKPAPKAAVRVVPTPVMSPAAQARTVGLTTRDLSAGARAAESDASPQLAELALPTVPGGEQGAPVGLLLVAGLAAACALVALWGVPHLLQRKP